MINNNLNRTDIENYIYILDYEINRHRNSIETMKSAIHELGIKMKILEDELSFHSDQVSCFESMKIKLINGEKNV